MGDSDDEYDRKRRDKFRGERAEASYRGAERTARPRDDWVERETWSRPRPREYRGVRDRGYSPSMEPMPKRLRNDYYPDSYYNHYYHQPAHRPGNFFREPSTSTQIEGQQPPMMSFKAFLATQDDNISDSEAIEKYNDYKLEFQRQQLNEYFVAHKDDEWFRLKYHPEDSVKKKEEQMAALKKRVGVFMDLLHSGKIGSVSIDCCKTNELLKLLDTVVIKLEDGTEEDLLLLDKEYAELEEKCIEVTVKEEKDVAKTNNDTEKPAIKEIKENANATEKGDEEGEIKENGDTVEEKRDEEQEKPNEEMEETKQIENGEKEEEKKTVEEKMEEEEKMDMEEEKPKSPSPSRDEEDDEKDKIEEDKEEGKEPTEGKNDQEETREEEKMDDTEVEGSSEKKRKRSYSDSSSSSGSSSSSEDEKDEKEEEPKEEEEEQEKKPTPKEEPEDVKEAVVEKIEDVKPTKPRALHKTTSIFLRNLAPTITKQEVEAICSRYDGFLRVALADPQPERSWKRRGWVTFKRDANIKEICWNLNNIRLRDCELGAIVNRDLSRRIRPINGVTAHKQIVYSDIRISTKVVLHMDSKTGLWQDEEEKKGKARQTFGLVSNNPVLHNITDYLIEEASAEEEELLGLDPTTDAQDSAATVERDDNLIAVLDRIILYLRMVHSIDYYNHCEYPNEDEMPNRCGILHARGPPPTTKTDMTQFLGPAVEAKMANFLPEKPKDENKNEAKLVALSLKDVDTEVEKFVQANTRELAKDKWLCPLSGKKFKGPDFVRKHIFNKHTEKIEEVKKEVEYFNNYLRDPKRPMLAETHQTRREEQPPAFGGGHPNYGGNYSGGYVRQPPFYNQGFGQRSRGYPMRTRGSPGDFRPVIHYRDLDAPREPEEFI